MVSVDIDNLLGVVQQAVGAGVGVVALGQGEVALPQESSSCLGLPLTSHDPLLVPVHPVRL